MPRQRRDLSGFRVDGDEHRFRQVLADQHLHLAVEGRTEQQPLTTGRGRVQQRSHGREEAEVTHVVGLVQHRDRDLFQGAGTAFDQVAQASRRGDDDVHSAPQ